jgi:hypothetical protein
VTHEWSRQNLNSYWRHQLAMRTKITHRAVALLSRRVLEQVIAWCVPGVARLHYTLATGGITSKSGACRHALDAFPPRWHPIIRDALTLREGRSSARRSGTSRYGDVLEFMEFVIEDANTGMDWQARGQTPVRESP